MDAWSAAWIGLACLAAGTEIAAFAATSGGGTLSAKVWQWITRPGDGRLRFRIGRAVTGLFLAWLFVHFLFGWLG